MKWYQWAWAMLPLVNTIPALEWGFSPFYWSGAVFWIALGVIGAVINVAIFRSSIIPSLKWAISLLIALVFFVAGLVGAIILYGYAGGSL